MFFRILAAAAICAFAQISPTDPFAGDYKSPEAQLTLRRGGDGGYTGTIVYQGASMPLSARAAGQSLLKGQFQTQGQSFPFELRREGSAVLFTTDGETYRLEPVAKAAGSSGLTGSWRNDKGIMRFNADGSGIALGEAFRYQTNGDTVTLISPQTNVSLQFEVSGDTLTLKSPTGQLLLTRVVESGAQAGRVQQDLTGKYCYVSNVYANNGGARSSNQCFTLYADGRYEYYGETDSYNPNGGATSQSSDRGTWSATETTITAKSVSGRVTTYQLEKRNHPKTNDPMIVLDGQAFVTAYQKAPWRY
jgi:hypothetical protein